MFDTLCVCVRGFRKDEHDGSQGITLLPGQPVVYVCVCVCVCVCVWLCVKSVAK